MQRGWGSSGAGGVVLYGLAIVALVATFGPGCFLSTSAPGEGGASDTQRDRESGAGADEPAAGSSGASSDDPAAQAPESDGDQEHDSDGDAAGDRDAPDAPDLAARMVTISAEPGLSFAPTHQIVGDMDGDGFDDFALFAMNLDTETQPAPAYETAIYLFYGRSELPRTLSATDADAVLRRLGSRFVMPVPAGQPIGDLNGDGLADLVIGGTSSVRFVFGSETRLSGELDVEETGLGWRFEQQRIETGVPDFPIVDAAHPVRVTPLGDVQGDGLADVGLTVVTGLSGMANLSATPDSQIKTAYVVTGREETWPSGMFDPAWAHTELVAADSATGCELLGAVDLDGDGHSDLLLRTGETTHLVQGGEDSPTGVVHADEVGTPFPVLHTLFRGLPDLDGDGSQELLWTEPSIASHAYIAYGGRDFDPEEYLAADLQIAGDGLNAGAIAAADFDGDGDGELLIATTGVSSVPGGFYVVPGGEGRRSGQLALGDEHRLLSSSATATNGNSLPRGSMGVTTDAGGDVNGDGVHDVLTGIAIPDSGNASLGDSEVLVILGGSEPL